MAAGALRRIQENMVPLFSYDITPQSHHLGTTIFIRYDSTITPPQRYTKERGPVQGYAVNWVLVPFSRMLNLTCQGAIFSARHPLAWITSYDNLSMGFGLSAAS